MNKNVIFLPTDKTGTTGTNIISLSDAKLWLRVDSDDDDQVVTMALNSAVQWVENYCGCYLEPKGGVFKISAFFDTHLPRGPLRSISDVTYGVNEFTDYFATEDEVSVSPKIRFVNPPVLDSDEQYPIDISATVGYDDIPPALIQACYWMLTYFYDHRSDFVVGTVISKLPKGIDSLLAQYRIMYFSYAGG